MIIDFRPNTKCHTWWRCSGSYVSLGTWIDCKLRFGTNTESIVKRGQYIYLLKKYQRSAAVTKTTETQQQTACWSKNMLGEEMRRKKLKEELLSTCVRVPRCCASLYTAYSYLKELHSGACAEEEKKEGQKRRLEGERTGLAPTGRT